MVKIPIKVLTELKFIRETHWLTNGLGLHLRVGDSAIEWHDNNGINTPYLVEWVNKED